MSEFQIIRNGAWADGYLIGLSVITVITYFFSIGVGVLIFIVFNFMFSMWLMTKWNFYKNNTYCTTLHHHNNQNINTKK